MFDQKTISGRNTLIVRSIKRRIQICLCVLFLVTSVNMVNDAATVSTSQVESKLSALISQYKDTRWTSTYYGGKECKGFATLIFDKIFDLEGSTIGTGSVSSNSTNYKLNNLNSTVTCVGTVYDGSLDAYASLLRKAKPGDFLQMRRRSSGGPHSMIVVSVTGSSLNIFDCNIDGKCTVKTYSQTFSAFREKNIGFSLYHSKKYLSDAETEISASSRTILTGDYYIVSAIDNQCSLDIPSSNGYAGQNVQVYSRNEQPAQLFTVERQNSGYYHIIHKGSGFVLDIGTGTGASGTNVQLQKNSNAISQDWVIEESGDEAYYFIRARKSGHYLEIENGKTANCTNVRILAKNNAKAQKWFFRTSGKSIGQTIADGDYMVATDLDQSMYMTMDANPGSVKNATNVFLKPDNKRNTQVFTFKYKGNGYYQIIEKQTGFSLEAASSQIARGGNAHMWSLSDSNEAEQWIVKKNGDAYNIINRYTGLYLDVKGVTAEDGKNIILWSMHTGGAEKWHLIPVKAGSEMAAGMNRTLMDGDYEIVSAEDTSKMVDIVGDTVPAAVGSNVQVYARSSRVQDVFTISYADGFYKICQKGTNRSLDVSWYGIRNDTNIQVAEYNGGSAQKWAIGYAGPRDGYALAAKCSGYFLTADKSGNVLQRYGNGSSAQSWLFIPYMPAQPIENGRYNLISMVADNLELDIYGDTGNVANGVNVQIWTDSAPSQYNSFDVIKLSGGYYKLVHAASGKVLGLAGAGSAFQTNVALFDDDGSYSQQWAITSSGSNGYILRSRATGYALDLQDARTDNGTNVFAYPCHGNTNQLWTFKRAEYTISYDAAGGSGAPGNQIQYYMGSRAISSTVPVRTGYSFVCWEGNGKRYKPGDAYTENADISLKAVWIKSNMGQLLPDGDYVIYSSLKSGLSLDISGTSYPAANGDNVYVWGDNYTPPVCDVWTVEYQNGFYTLIQKGTSKALDVQSVSIQDGGNIQVWEKNTNPSQQWMINYSSAENGYVLTAKCSGYVLTVEGGATGNGTNVVQKIRNESTAQSWVFVPYEPSQPIENGRYVLTSALGDNLELDVAGDRGDIPSGQNVQIWNDGAPSQFNSFDIVKLSGGYYKLVHAASGKVLGVDGSGTGMHQNVAVLDDNGSYSQQWAIMPSNGGYVLRSRLSGYSLDISCFKTEDGTNVLHYPCTQTVNQIWNFVPAEYSVKYDALGGTGGPATQTKYYKGDMTISEVRPYKEGHLFLGWTEIPGSDEVSYIPGDIIQKDETMTLYAVWLEKDAVLPGSLKQIEEEAFRENVFRFVYLQDGITTIGKRAFADCHNLRQIRIPDSATLISADAFEGVTELTIVGIGGSYAEFYAETYGYEFVKE